MWCKRGYIHTLFLFLSFLFFSPYCIKKERGGGKFFSILLSSSFKIPPTKFLSREREEVLGVQISFFSLLFFQIQNFITRIRHTITRLFHSSNLFVYSFHVWIRFFRWTRTIVVFPIKTSGFKSCYYFFSWDIVCSLPVANKVSITWSPMLERKK